MKEYTLEETRELALITSIILNEITTNCIIDIFDKAYFIAQDFLGLYGIIEGDSRWLLERGYDYESFIIDFFHKYKT
jgi:hypothetical protein